MNQDTENSTRELLKKSMLKVSDEAFSNRIMERIHLEAQRKRRILPSLSAAWIFIILSIVLIPFGLPLIAENFQSIKILYLGSLIFDPTMVWIILSILLAIVILYILENLIRLTFRR